jgi:hypothetical protein
MRDSSIERDSLPPVGPRRSRRSRQPVRRGRTVRFSLSEAEFAELEGAAARARVARGALAAAATLAVARGGPAAGPGEGLRDVLAELIRAAGLVRRIGTNLNQAVARLHATGQQSAALAAYAAESIRRADRLDEIAEQVRTAIR